MQSVKAKSFSLKRRLSNIKPIFAEAVLCETTAAPGVQQDLVQSATAVAITESNANAYTNAFLIQDAQLVDERPIIDATNVKPIEEAFQIIHCTAIRMSELGVNQFDKLAWVEEAQTIGVSEIIDATSVDILNWLPPC